MSIEQLEEALKDESTEALIWYDKGKLRSDILALIEKKRRDMFNVKPGGITPWPTEPSQFPRVVDPRIERDRLDRYVCAAMVVNDGGGYLSNEEALCHALHCMSAVDKHLERSK